MLTRGTYRFGVECALQRSFAGLALLFLLLWSVSAASLAASPMREREPLTLAAAVGLAALTAVLAGRGARTRIGRGDAVAAVITALAADAAFAVERPATLVAGLRCTPTAAAVLLAVGFLPRRPAWVLSVVALGAQVVAGQPGTDPSGALEAVWPAAAAAVAAAALAPALRAAGLRADTAVEDDIAARAQVARARAARRAQREFQRVLHDDVCAALRVAAMPGVPPPQQRAQARRALAALTSGLAEPDGDAVVDLVTAVAAVVTASIDGFGGARLTADYPPDGTPVSVPRYVADAFTGAAAEALRNAALHADATRIEVRLRGSKDTIDLTVSDDGVGFSPSQVRETSVGLRRSVRQRLEDVGGSAEVVSAPGRGTTVRLRRRSAEAPDGAAPPPPAPGRLATMAATVGDIRRPLAAVCVPYLAVMACVAVVHCVRLPAMRWYLLWYAVLGAATGALLTRAHRGISRRTAVGWSSFAVAGAVSSLLVMPPTGITDYTSWPIGAVTPLLTLLVIVRPAWESLLALACEEIGVTLLVAHRPPPGQGAAAVLTTALPALLAPALGVVMGAAIARTLVRLGRAVLDVQQHRLAVVTAESAARARAAQHRKRLADLDEQVTPFLSALACGRLRDDSPGLRGQARRLGQSIRDELHVPGALDRDVRALISATRAAGCTVTVHAGPDENDEAPVEGAVPAALVREMLTAALRRQAPPSELVLSLQADAGCRSVSLVASPGDPNRAAALRAALRSRAAQIEDSPDLTWAEVRLEPPDLTAAQPPEEPAPALGAAPQP